MTDVRALWVVLGLLLVGGLLYLLSPVLTPFLLSAVLAYMFNPLVTRAERWRVPRTLSVLLLFVLLAGLLVLLATWLVPRAQQQLAAFADVLPGELDALQRSWLPWLQRTFGDHLSLPDLDAVRQQIVDHWQELGRSAGDLLATLTRSGMRVAAWIMNLLLVPVVSFYLLRDWNRIVARLQELLPFAIRPTAIRLARETDEVLGAFLRGQLLVMVALATIYTTGLWLLGLDLALPIGMIAGLVSFVPYLGFIVGLGSAGIAALFQFPDPWTAAWVPAVFGVGQLLDATLLTPNLVGDRIGLHPVAVIFAVLAGAQLFGFLGVLLALPSAAVIVVWLRHLHRRLVPDSTAARPRRRRS